VKSVFTSYRCVSGVAKSKRLYPHSSRRNIKQGKCTQSYNPLHLQGKTRTLSY